MGDHISRRAFLSAAAVTPIAAALVQLKPGEAITAVPPLDLKKRTLYVGLCNADGEEISGSGYIRGEVQFEADGTTALENPNTVEFGTPANEWGKIDAWGIYDHKVDGELLALGRIENPKSVGRYRRPEIRPKHLRIPLNADSMPEGMTAALETQMLEYLFGRRP